MTVQETTIRRIKKYEAEQAIADLEKRGYEVIVPLAKQERIGKDFTKGKGNRLKFVEHVMSDVWICKLRRVVE